MKRILLLIALAICFQCYSQNLLKIEPELRDELQVRSGGELLRINIIMNDQYDQDVLHAMLSAYRLKEEKRDFVVNELKRYAHETQQNVMSYLNYFANNESVTEIKQFWIFNGINCYATQEVIEALSYLEDINLIGLDKEYHLLPEKESPRIADDTREITYNVTKVNANLVWDLGYEGEGVIVAIFDTGVNYNHIDLKSHMWNHPDYPKHGWNFVKNTNDPMDDFGHGTHCAGTIAGDGKGGSKTGMAPKATIMALKVFDNNGTGAASTTVSAMQFALEHGAQVFSLSIGWRTPNASTKMMFRKSMQNVLEAGVIAAVAAGNDGENLSQYPVPQNVGAPGDCPPPLLHPDQTTTGGLSAVVCVGATNSNDYIASFSSRGPVTWQTTESGDYPYNPGIGLIRPDVCAPGVDIKSLAYNSSSGYLSGWEGTSMATPCVAGVMALMLSKNPNLTPAQICEILETTAKHLTPQKSNQYGSGRIDALAAVSAVTGCEGILNLDYSLDYNMMVNLTWDKPEDETLLIGYNVYVDNVLYLISIEEESCIFYALEEGDYNVCVTALFQSNKGLCESPKVCENISVKKILAPPANLTATPSSSAFEIVVKWEYNGNGVVFKLFRDDEIIADNISNKQYIDTNISASIQYCYVVKAWDGVVISAPSNEDCARFSGIEEHPKLLKVYPNPSNSTVYIEGEGMEKITIVNSAGQIINIVPATDQLTSIDVSQLTSGNYFLNIFYIDGSTGTAKIIVK